MGRARIVLAMVVLAATGLGVVAFLHERDEALRTEDAPVADASADARATAAKGKPAPKKKAARSGKTRVSGRANPGSGAHTAGAHTAGAHTSSARHDHDPAPSDEATPAPAVTPHRHYAAPSGASYESALDSNNQQLNMGAKTGPDLNDSQLSAPMSDGTFVSDCGAPDDMGVTVKIAIKMGRAVGVSVSTSPHSADVANCIDHHVRRLSWPASPKMDSFVTTY